MRPMIRPMRWLVDAIYFCAAAALAPLVAYRAYTTGKYRQDWDQRPRARS